MLRPNKSSAVKKLPEAGPADLAGRLFRRQGWDLLPGFGVLLNESQRVTFILCLLWEQYP